MKRSGAAAAALIEIGYFTKLYLFNKNLATRETSTVMPYIFAVVPKSLDNPFFNATHVGCMDAALTLGVECLWTAPERDDPMLQANITLDLIRARAIDGLAVSVHTIDIMAPVITESVQAGIPVVTFDSDAPNTERSVYVGTDNEFFGQELGKVLNDLEPYGGSFAIVAGSAPNIVMRSHALERYLQGTGKWEQLPNSPSDSDGDPQIAIKQLREFVIHQPKAIVSVMGAPMRSGQWVDVINEIDPYRNITVICGDAMQNQLELLSRGYVGGLVGQLPYEMGYHAIEELFKILHGMHPQQEVIGTNVLIHLRVPLVLPELVVNNNRIGDLHHVGYVLFGLIAIAAHTFGWWTWRNRNHQVVKVSQPLFLILVASGVFVMASSILPLSQDDGGRQVCEGYRCIVMCMSIPWLGFLGFIMTFTALFSKTWRVNRIFHAKVAYTRMKIAAKDVVMPLAAMLTVNIIILTCWTIFDPLTYVRKPLDGTDGWNRVIATYGSCSSHHTARYLIPLVALTLVVMIVANWQAFQARAIQSEFSESKYIAIAIASMLQAALIGIPTLFVVRKSPSAHYLIVIFALFVISMAVLFLIFTPKIIIHHHFQRLSPREKRQFIRNSIRLSQTSISSLRQHDPLVETSVGVERRPTQMSSVVANSENQDAMLVVNPCHWDSRNPQGNGSVVSEGDADLSEDREVICDYAVHFLPGESRQDLCVSRNKRRRC